MSEAVVQTRVRAGFYLDSVALMRIAHQVAARTDVLDAALMIGSPSNKALLREAGLFDSAAEAAGPNDLIVAVRADGEAALAAGLAAAEAALLAPAAGGEAAGGNWRPRTLETGLETLPEANLAIVSVPGDFAAREARRALRRGLHVLLFSDNVPIEDEVALKDLAIEHGLLMMGPDCGTAVLAGQPLGFANAVPRGDIGLIAASGTGLQEIACLVARAGGGISHGIGVGGRDLGREVGGRMTLAAIEGLDRDPGTRRIVLVSKPPDAATAQRIAGRIARSRKQFTLCFIGMAPMDLPGNATQVATLRAAAAEATGADGIGCTPGIGEALPRLRPGGLRGLFAGGSLCAEAQAVLIGADVRTASNAAIPGAVPVAQATDDTAVMLDLGADEYTRGRPHPMIEPAVRADPLAQAMADPGLAALLVDVVIGYGAHEDPAGRLVAALGAPAPDGPLVIASVCGTEADPQVRSDQVRILRKAGVLVAASNAEAAELAAALLAG